MSSPARRRDDPSGRRALPAGRNQLVGVTHADEYARPRPSSPPPPLLADLDRRLRLSQLALEPREHILRRGDLAVDARELLLRGVEHLLGPAPRGAGKLCHLPLPARAR